jgi:hypothetical protein
MQQKLQELFDIDGLFLASKRGPKLLLLIAASNP